MTVPNQINMLHVFVVYIQCLLRGYKNFSIHAFRDPTILTEKKIRTIIAHLEAKVINTEKKSALLLQNIGFLVGQHPVGQKTSNICLVYIL
jgi:hypothetical protein